MTNTESPKTETKKKVEEEQKTKQCPLYRVLVHNDDVTYDFVIRMLTEVFKLEEPKAAEVAWEAHIKGLALVVVLPLEQAEFRVDQAHSIARTKKFPLTFTYEPE
jgi:ATP-dependent Clp protease adaptor protein ClpS